MKLGFCFPVVFWAAAIVPNLVAQTRTSNSTAAIRQELERLLQPVGITVNTPSSADSNAGRGTSMEEIRLQISGLNVSADAPATENRANLRILDRRRGTEFLRQRSIDLATDRLVVAFVDRQSNLAYWLILPDPRVIRAEEAGPDGRIRGTVLIRPDAQLLMPSPDEPAVTGVRLFQPVWNGTSFKLAAVGATELR